MLLSHIGVCVTNNNGFCIWWLDLLALLYIYNQSWQDTISGCLRLAPVFTGLRASSLPLWRMTNDGSLLTHWTPLRQSQSQSHITTDGQSVSKSWRRTTSGAHDQIFITVWQLRSYFMWGALSDERMGLSFVYATGPCQRSLSQVRVPWYSRSFFTVSELRLPFSSPPTTRRNSLTNELRLFYNFQATRI
jgi:hypothetical protein